MSSDRSADDAAEYFAEMPWHTLKYSEREAKAQFSMLFEIRGIPSLVLLNGEGECVTKDGRSVVMEQDMEDWKI